MSLSPVIGTEVPEAANGVLTDISPEPCSENGPPHAPGSFKCGGSRLVPCPGQGSEDRLVPCPGQGSEDAPLGDAGQNHVDHVETGVCDGEGRLEAELDSSVTHDLDARPHTTSLPSPHALLGPSAPTATCTGGGTEIGPQDTEILPEVSPRSGESPGAAPRGDSPQHTESKDSPQRADPVGVADRQQADTVETVEVSAREEMDGDGEKEKQDEEDDEKREKQRWKQHDAGSPEDDEVTQPSSHYSSSAPCPSTSCASSPPPAALLPGDNIVCPPHVMAQVRVRNVPERERIVRGMQDSKSLDEISQACGGHGLGSRGGSRGGQSEGRRATISSALELEGTVSHDGDLTHFVAKNLELKIKMSSKPSLDCSDSDCSGPIQRSRGSARRPADIPPIDPAVLTDLQRHTQEVAHSVEMMMRSLNGTIQNMTALSVGYIQTYRDSVDGLGEAVDMSIKGMYTLMARCEELDRSMQPIHTLAAQIRDIKRTLDALEAICK